MIEGIPRISVLIICYKQEKLIRRAINSLLAQKDYIYEICVSDDCSPDRTWEVLQEYDKQYPGLFKLHRNEPNVGIFENFEQVWTMPTGDIVYSLAGDDECGDRWFKTVVGFIKNNNIDYKKELFCIYGDYKCSFPNGDSVIVKNECVKNASDVVRLGIRGLICNRSTVCNIGVLRKFVKCSQGRSYIAEMAQDRQLQLFSDANYYIPMVGNIYYARIGVSAHLDVEKLKQREECRPYAKQIMEKLGYTIRRKDYYYMKKDEEVAKLYRENKIIGYIKIIYYRLRSFDYKIDANPRIVKRIVFALIRRCPHSKPIHWTI